jgi:hypothetical protein
MEQITAAWCLPGVLSFFGGNKEKRLVLNRLGMQRSANFEQAGGQQLHVASEGRGYR